MTRGSGGDLAFHTLSLCAGVGGLDLGVRIARPDARCVAFVEREASAAASLVASMEAGRLHPAAIWSDLRTFDAGAWRGAVDCVLSGDPCQGNSVAGKRLGADDDRWLLDRAIEVFDQSGAHAFFRENVPGNLAGQLAAAFPALERLGCRVACGIFSAAEAGASHRRERFFLLAQRSMGDSAGPRSLPGAFTGVCGREEGSGARDAEPQRRGRSLAHAVGLVEAGWLASAGEAEGGRNSASGASGQLADADAARSQGRRSSDRTGRRQEPDECAGLASGALDDALRGRHWDADEEIRAGRRTRASLPFAPRPSDHIWREIIRDAPMLEPAVCRMAHGVAGRIERLRHCGNGVVPLAAALAWVRLHGLLADDAASDAVRFADDRTARAGDAAVTRAQSRDAA